MRDGELCWAKMPMVLEDPREKPQHFPWDVGGTKDDRKNMMRHVICYVALKEV